MDKWDFSNIIIINLGENGKMIVNVLKEITERVSMRDLLDYYGIHPKRSTNNYTCLFHSPDYHPSAAITKDGHRLKCYACGAYASIFDVVCKLNDCNYKTALRIIDHNFNLNLIDKLTHQQKLEIARIQKEREHAKKETEQRQQFEKHALNRICKELRMWEKCEQLTHLTRGEYRRGQWKYSDLYFYALEQQKWLNWLYETICEFKDKQECEYDYIYGTNKNEILKKIKNGEIYL